MLRLHASIYIALLLGTSGCKEIVYEPPQESSESAETPVDDATSEAAESNDPTAQVNGNPGQQENSANGSQSSQSIAEDNAAGTESTSSNGSLSGSETQTNSTKSSRMASLLGGLSQHRGQSGTHANSGWKNPQDANQYALRQLKIAKQKKKPVDAVAAALDAYRAAAHFPHDTSCLSTKEYALDLLKQLDQRLSTQTNQPILDLPLEIK